MAAKRLSEAQIRALRYLRDQGPVVVFSCGDFHPFQMDGGKIKFITVDALRQRGLIASRQKSPWSYESEYRITKAGIERLAEEER